MSGERVLGAGGRLWNMFTDELLSGAESVDLRDVRKEIRKRDREKMLEKCAESHSLLCRWGRRWGGRSCGIV